MYRPGVVDNVITVVFGLAQDLAQRSLSLHAAGSPSRLTHSAIDSRTCRASRQMSSSLLSVASDPFMLCICFCVAETQVRKLPGLTASPVDVCCDVLQHSHVHVLCEVQYVHAKACFQTRHLRGRNMQMLTASLCLISPTCDR